MSATTEPLRPPTLQEVRQFAAEVEDILCCEPAALDKYVVFKEADLDARALILMSLRSRGEIWRASNNPRIASLAWTNSIRADFAHSLMPGCLINRFPWSFALSRKDELYATLKSLKYPFLPEAFALPQEIQALRLALDEANSSELLETSLWVVKPARSGGARKIHVLNSAELADSLSNRSRRPVIVQRYLPHLSLIDGHKCHLRVYALIAERNLDSSKRDKAVLVHREGMVMIATERFDLSSRSSFVHVTNNRVQYADHCGALPANWSIQSQLRQYINEKYGTGRFEALWSRIKTVLVTAIWAVIDKWCSDDKAGMVSASTQDLGVQCFQLIGADICAAKDFTEAWLLELNTNPALYAGLDPNQGCEPGFSISAAVVCDVLNIVLAPKSHTPSLGGFELIDPLEPMFPSTLTSANAEASSSSGGNALIAGTDRRQDTAEMSSQMYPMFNDISLLSKTKEHEATPVDAKMLAKHAFDALVQHMQWPQERAHILHIGSSNLPLEECVQHLWQKIDVSHCNHHTTGVLSLNTFAFQGQFIGVVDDSATDRRSSSFSGRILRHRCCEIARLLQPCACFEDSASHEQLSTPCVLVLFSWTNGSNIISETFDLLHSARLHLNEHVLWMHVAQSRASTKQEPDPLMFRSHREGLPDWVRGPAVKIPLSELAACLLSPDARYDWSLVAPPGRLGNSTKLDSVAHEAGLLCVEGVARRPAVRSKSLIFVDLHGSSDEFVGIKCDAEWLLPAMMLAAAQIKDGDLLRVEGIIIRRLHGGNRANLLALNLLQLPV